MKKKIYNGNKRTTKCIKIFILTTVLSQNNIVYNLAGMALAEVSGELNGTTVTVLLGAIR